MEFILFMIKNIYVDANFIHSQNYFENIGNFAVNPNQLDTV